MENTVTALLCIISVRKGGFLCLGITKGRTSHIYFLTHLNGSLAHMINLIISPTSGSTPTGAAVLSLLGHISVEPLNFLLYKNGGGVMPARLYNRPTQTRTFPLILTNAVEGGRVAAFTGFNISTY